MTDIRAMKYDFIVAVLVMRPLLVTNRGEDYPECGHLLFFVKFLVFSWNNLANLIVLLMFCIEYKINYRRCLCSSKEIVRILTVHK
jgi:hypothetical protein